MPQKKTISRRKWRGLFVITLAALLLEGISGVQYLLTRQQMEDELEKRAESELTLKAIIIKSKLNACEDLLRNSMWKIEAHIDQPDSAYTTLKRFVRLNPSLKGASVGFIPNYYPQKGRLYEVYAQRTPSGEVEARQIGGETHDYTQFTFYEQALGARDGVWVDPYYDHEGAHALITSYFRQVCNRKGHPIGFFGIDFDVRSLSDTINSRHIYPSSFILVLTETDNIVIHPDSGHVGMATQQHIYKLITDSTMARRQPSGSRQSTIIDFNTGQRDGSIFYASMKGKPHWKIAVVCYDDEVYAPLTQLRLWLLGLMLVAFTILLYVVWRFARSEQTMESTSRLLEEKTQQQEHINAELRVANGIQQALLPQAEPSLQGVNEVEVEGCLMPAKAVGGDLYNVFVRNGKLFFCIGDVSGKGVPAALIMAVTQVLFRHVASHEDDPAHIMSRLNEAACRNNRQNFFVTLFIGVLDLPTGHLRYCNAGHEVPVGIQDAMPNIPIGLFDDYKFQMQKATMQPGALLFLYTDGLTEARNAGHSLFGYEYLNELTTRCSGMNAKEVVDTVIDEVTQFAGGTEQNDDLTLLAIRYTPPENTLTLDEQITLSNKVKELTRLSTFIKDIMARLGISAPLAPNLRLALEEAVVNVMEYAYPAGKQGDITVRTTYDGERLRLIISDSGIAFNPTKAAKADTTLSAEERPVGGLGILLMRELMDFVNYERIDGRNILTLTKRIERQT